MLGRTFVDVEESPTLRTPPAGLLVVEDDLDHRETLREILEEEGYRVETAIHGRDALDRLSAGPPPDLILLDLMMPEMDGWAFMGELNAREALASIPIVVTSQVGNRVPQSASTRFISKPLDRTRLLQTISACLWRRSRGEAASRFTRVLVLADSMIGTTIARLLAWDHDVVAVTSATAALGRIHTGERFDAILCDVQMPDMSGMDLYARLASNAPEQAARMVFMTGVAPAPEVDAFLRRASSRWIETPFTMTELRALIQLLVTSAPGRKPLGSSA
jgi:CheY-like chemotaxis protein